MLGLLFPAALVVQHPDRVVEFHQPVDAAHFAIIARVFDLVQRVAISRQVEESAQRRTFDHGAHGAFHLGAKWRRHAARRLVDVLRSPEIAAGGAVLRVFNTIGQFQTFAMAELAFLRFFVYVYNIHA